MDQDLQDLGLGGGRSRRGARQAAVTVRGAEPGILRDWQGRARAPVKKMYAHRRVDRVTEPPITYLIGEKSVGSMNTDSTLLTILPLASDSFCTFCHSGSLRNSSQFFLAASRLACAMT
jgi:hypothetical protein